LPLLCNELFGLLDMAIGNLKVRITDHSTCTALPRSAPCTSLPQELAEAVLDWPRHPRGRFWPACAMRKGPKGVREIGVGVNFG
jgi:hypothetical protein